MSDRLYGALHSAREKLCIAQTDVEHQAHHVELQAALDTIDRLGAFYAPGQWSRFDEPLLPGEQRTASDEATYFRKRVDDWREMPILGHGLYARYQDADLLLVDALKLIDPRPESGESGDGL